jgi:hypothetical protein
MPDMPNPNGIIFNLKEDDIIPVRKPFAGIQETANSPA